MNVVRSCHLQAKVTGQAASWKCSLNAQAGSWGGGGMPAWACMLEAQFLSAFMQHVSHLSELPQLSGKLPVSALSPRCSSVSAAKPWLPHASGRVPWKPAASKCSTVAASSCCRSSGSVPAKAPGPRLARSLRKCGRACVCEGQCQACMQTASAQR